MITLTFVLILPYSARRRQASNKFNQNYFLMSTLPLSRKWLSNGENVQIVQASEREINRNSLNVLLQGSPWVRHALCPLHSMIAAKQEHFNVESLG